jgi:arsenate reductase
LERKFSSKTYTEQELISILANYPKLLQRPIVIIGNKAIIARDLEKLEQFLNIKKAELIKFRFIFVKIFESFF